MENTNTNSDKFALFPKVSGQIFTVADYPEKRKTVTGKIFYLFKFTTVMEGKKKTYSQGFMVWKIADLLRGLRCTETKKGEFEWDRGEVMGRQVRATIIHDPDKKDKSKTWARMVDITPYEGDSDSPQEEQQAEPASVEDSTVPF